MKPDFNKMSRSELRAYVLEHRDDDEAIHAYFYRPDAKRTKMPSMFDEDGNLIKENIRIAEEMIRQRIERSRNQGQERLNGDEDQPE